MMALVLAMALVAAGPSAGGPVEGALRESTPDLSMALARRAPLALQPVVLMLLDTGLPLAGAVAVSAAGGVAGAVAAGALARGNGARHAAPLWAAAGASTGMAVGALCAFLLADLAWSSFHGGHVRPSRVLFLLPLATTAVLAAGVAAAWTRVGMPPGPAWAVAGVVGALLGGAVVTQALALVSGTAGLVLGRARTDHDEGSALLEPAN